MIAQYHIPLTDAVSKHFHLYNKLITQHNCLPTEVYWLCGLRSAKNKNKIWQTWLLLLRFNCLEQTVTSDHDITDTSTFRKRLKNVLFDLAIN